MTSPATIPSAGADDTITVSRDLRMAFLADFTRNTRGAHVFAGGARTGCGLSSVETENQPFDGIVPDVKDGEDAGLDHLWFDARPASHTRRPLRCHRHSCAPWLFTERLAKAGVQVMEPRQLLELEPPGGLRASTRYGGLAMTPREALEVVSFSDLEIAGRGEALALQLLS